LKTGFSSKKKENILFTKNEKIVILVLRIFYDLAEFPMELPAKS
jgi:hypothetical protein